MSDSTNRHRSYSADVRMQLHVNGHILAIGQLGPDFIMLKEPIDLPPSPGEIMMTIDGRIKTWLVQLPDGIAANDVETRIAQPADEPVVRN